MWLLKLFEKIYDFSKNKTKYHNSKGNNSIHVKFCSSTRHRNTQNISKNQAFDF